MSSPSENFSSTEGITLADLLTADNYLDAEKRYQLRQPFIGSQNLSEEAELSVIDCKPAADSPIAVMHEESESFNSGNAPTAERLPQLAYPYWELKDQFFPVIPELQAAWQDLSFTILILEDRSTWQPLSDAWSSAAGEPLELIHWFYEMANLWDKLAAFEAEPSLLSSQNLLIDDDQILCLKRLLYRPSDRPCEIKELGLFWESLLKEAPTDQLTALKTLATEIGTSTITEISAVKERLAAIADEMQEESAIENAVIPEVTSQEDTSEMAGSLPPLTLISEAEANSETLLKDDELFMAEPSEAIEDLGNDDIEDKEAEASEEGIGDLSTVALPVRLHRLDEVGRTHVGRQRTHNEDTFYAETDFQRIDSPSGSTLKVRGLYLLCDGMGGHAGGEVASQLAVNTLRDYFEDHWQVDMPNETTIKDAILQANQAIFDKNESEGRTGSARMGTTLVMVLLADTQAVVAHVGDSRLYSITRNDFKQLTTDHEVGQREIKRGVEPAIAYARPDAYQLTQALGPRGNDEVLPNITNLCINQDTLLLLCSDGLSDDNLVEKYAETHVKPLLRSQADLDEGVSNLIDLANKRNGHDNITAIAIRIKVRPNIEVIGEQF